MDDENVSPHEGLESEQTTCRYCDDEQLKDLLQIPELFEYPGEVERQQVLTEVGPFYSGKVEFAIRMDTEEQEDFYANGLTEEDKQTLLNGVKCSLMQAFRHFMNSASVEMKKGTFSRTS